jgi:four helix bundle protein
VDKLPETRLGRHVAGQIIRCGTSPAPNYAEACSAESREDFIHKLSICLKELRETHLWLRLIAKAGLAPGDEVDAIQDECFQLNNIIAQSIITAKSNRTRRRTQ